MDFHSKIVDNFFDKPDEVRSMILNSPMGDHTGSDNVKYPGIVPLLDSFWYEMGERLQVAVGQPVDVDLLFARHSMEEMDPPNWAHSDMNMTDYVCLIYMNPQYYPWDGTHFLKHRKTGMETHPENDEQVSILLNESNKRENWDVTHTCYNRYNRAFIFDARYIHAAACKYGSDRMNSRLVLSVFFKLK